MTESVENCISELAKVQTMQLRKPFYKGLLTVDSVNQNWFVYLVNVYLGTFST